MSSSNAKERAEGEVWQFSAESREEIKIHVARCKEKLRSAIVNSERARYIVNR